MGLTLHDTHGHSHGGHGYSHDSHSNHAHSSYGATTDASKERGEEEETVLSIPETKEPSVHAHAHNKQNINVRAAFIHVIGDFLQSLGVMIAAFVVYFKARECLSSLACFIGSQLSFSARMEDC
jgi:zinc transporter 2